jgi:hypothetical protein
VKRKRLGNKLGQRGRLGLAVETDSRQVSFCGADRLELTGGRAQQSQKVCWHCLPWCTVVKFGCGDSPNLSQRDSFSKILRCRVLRHISIPRKIEVLVVVDHRVKTNGSNSFEISNPWGMNCSDTVLETRHR